MAIMKGLTLRMSDRFVGLDLLKDKVVRSKPLQHSRMNNTAHMKYMFRNTHSTIILYEIENLQTRVSIIFGIII